MPTMCRRYRIINPDAAYLLALQIADDDMLRNIEANEAIFSPAEMPVIHNTDRGRTLARMRWGVERADLPETKPHQLVVNARDDKLAGRMWKGPVQSARCVIPADGFFEWDGPDGSKWPVALSRIDDRPFFFAGVIVPDRRSLTAAGFAIVTTVPNALVTPLQDRMPVMLDLEMARAWMIKGPLAQERLVEFCRPYPAEQMKRKDYPVPVRTKKAAPAPAQIQPELF